MQRDSLHDFVESLSGDSHLRVQDDLGDGFVRLRAAEAQRRQAQQDIRSIEDVVIEMLRNARDAGAHLIFVATGKDAHTRYLTMIDDGSGIPEGHHETVFEPFVTSKLDSFHADRWGVHGRGMALYSIKENAAVARVLKSAPGQGSVFHVETKLDTLPEKRDQSTPPAIVFDEDGSPVLRGPHNIIRTTMEFAIDERERVGVYLGSSTEIAATLYEFGIQAGLATGSFFTQERENLPFFCWLATAQTPEEFSTVASELGLSMSERSARRILDGAIEPLKPLISLLVPEQESNKEPLSSGAHVPKPRKIRFASDELQTFTHEIQQAYESLARAYYLNSQVEIKTKAGHNTLTISIPLEPLS